jgi:seryl-tRNA synthetase
MLDIRFIRENAQVVKDNLRKKFQEDKLNLVDQLLKKDEDYRKMLQKAEELRHERNTLTQKINETKKKGGDIASIVKKAKDIPGMIQEIETKTDALKIEVLDLQKRIPNIIHESVPIGRNDKENVERAKFGKPRKFDFEVKNHAELCEALGIADFDAAARVSGNGFYYMMGDLALLSQAMMQFAIQFMVKRGFTYVEPPLMIRHKIVDGVVDMNFFKDMVYKIEGEDLYLIATSEHPLIGMFVDQVVEEKRLPILYCGFSPCFRKEIGAHGIDEKGLYRRHQFNKVEQVVICKPGESMMFYDRILKNSIDLFKELGLPTRVFESCSGDLGDLKHKGADLEVWSPRKEGYFEACSASNLTDCQARRLNIKVDNGQERYFPHTLNNTVITTSRALVAILENYQNKDGSIDIPKALQPFMMGIKKISAKSVEKKKEVQKDEGVKKRVSKK